MGARGERAWWWRWKGAAQHPTSTELTDQPVPPVPQCPGRTIPRMLWPGWEGPSARPGVRWEGCRMLCGWQCASWRRAADSGFRRSDGGGYPITMPPAPSPFKHDQPPNHQAARDVCWRSGIEEGLSRGLCCRGLEVPLAPGYHSASLPHSSAVGGAHGDDEVNGCTHARPASSSLDAIFGSSSSADIGQWCCSLHPVWLGFQPRCSPAAGAGWGQSWTRRRSMRLGTGGGGLVGLGTGGGRPTVDVEKREGFCDG